MIYAILGSSIILNIFLAYLIFGTEKSIKEYSINKFKEYNDILQYFQDKSFDIIYKDKILAYSVSGETPSTKEFDAIAKEFCKLVLSLMGDNMKDDFINLYGSEETLLLNFMEYFNTKSENDEIKEATLNNLMES